VDLAGEQAVTKRKNTSYLDRLRALHVEGKTHREVMNERQAIKEIGKTRAAGSRHIYIRPDAETTAALMYLQKEWGFGSVRETVEAALGFTMVATKLGLRKLDTNVYAAMMRLEKERQTSD
jgi:hypothetical protein